MLYCRVNRINVNTISAVKELPVGVIVIGEGISVKQFEVEMFVLDKVPFCSFERRNDYIISIGINTVDKMRVLYGQVPANGNLFLIYRNTNSDSYEKFLENVASDDYFNTSYEDIMQSFSIVQLHKLISTVFKFEKQIKKDNLIINIYKK